MVNKKNLRSAYIAIGLMLFALFFGAGNLIFPAALGQNAGENFLLAMLGFLATGVGLPLLGVVAIGYSGCKNLQELAGRVHPTYGLIFTILLYLTIGPFFAIPRTGSVSYEIGIKPFLGNIPTDFGLAGFLVVFFVITWWFSARPTKLVDRVGKVLTPALLFFLVILILQSFLNPMGIPQAATEAYASTGLALSQGFLDGYNTMDALASLVFGFLIVKAIKLYGVDSEGEIAIATLKSGLVASVCLALIYIFLSNIGATSVSQIGLQATGAPVLSLSADYYFGNAGPVILAFIVILACLTTSIGLVSSCASYFNELVPSFSYIKWVTFFSCFSATVGLFGLSTIISAAIPVLMFLYPLTIVLICLALLDKTFKGKQAVYVSTITFTFIMALYDGLNTAGINFSLLNDFLKDYVPLFSFGLGWFIFSLIGFIIGNIYLAIKK